MPGGELLCLVRDFTVDDEHAVDAFVGLTRLMTMMLTGL